jgi:hypothetical protein
VSAEVSITIEFDDPKLGPLSGRWATVRVGGHRVMTELVYDTNADGERTEEQARDNALAIFSARLSRLLEEH